MSNTLKLSLVIPAYNEKMNIIPTIRKLSETLRKEKIPFEMIIVNDCCTDGTQEIVEEERKNIPEIKLINKGFPRGFGRAVRVGISNITGDIMALVMADLSDDPDDLIQCYRKIEEGYDCVFGSRFKKKSKITNYPIIKLIVNRIVNRMLQLLFWTKHNDLTNAFKVYRSHVIREIQPLYACHFNITIELSLSALIRNYKIASIPIQWNGRTWGQSNLKLRSMGRRYLATLLKIWFEKLLILDDVMAENKKNEEINNSESQIQFKQSIEE